MSAVPQPRRRTGWVLFVSLLVVAVFGLVVVWGMWSGVRSLLAGIGLAEPTPIKYDQPDELSDVSVPHQPSVLAWSADGAYVAGGAWGWDSPEEGKAIPPSEVYVVDVAKSSVASTLEAKGMVNGLAFSPDGK